MTDLKNKVRRRTISAHRGRRIVVSLLPGDVLAFREERTRREFLLTINAAYTYAVKLDTVERRMREKAAKRKGTK